MARKNSFWDNTAKNVVYTSKVLNYSTHDLFFHSILFYTEEPKAYNLLLAYICGELYSLIKPLPVRYKQSDACTIIYYKPPLVSREDK